MSVIRRSGYSEVQRRRHHPALSGFLWWFLTALSFLLRSGESRAGEPSTEEWARRFGTQPLQLPAGDWQSTTERLAAALKTSVVAFTPPRWEPRQIEGAPTEVLNHLAEAAGGKWRTMPGVLRLFPVHAVKGMEFDEAEIMAFKARSRKEDQFAYSLTPAQLAIVAKGARIPIADLTENQKILLREYFHKHVGNGPAVWTKYLKDGQIGLHLEASVTFYWRGTYMDTLQGVPRSEWKEHFLWKERRSKEKKPPVPASSAVERFFGKETLTLAETRPLELVQLEGLLTPLLQKRCPGCEFCVSARIRKSGYVVSKGTWPVAVLLTALGVGDDLELRSVADVVFLTAAQQKQWLLKNLDDSRDCELNWRLLRPLVQSLKANPHNELGPWTFEQLLEPRLIPLSQRPPDQQESWLPAYVLVNQAVFNQGGPAREAALASARKELRQEISAIELHVYPSVHLSFWLDGKRQFSAGVAGLENYGWLMRRTK
jgi:hypothetical protein